MRNIDNKYRPFPFWSWNDELDKDELVRQIDWMHDAGIGGFFMHARGGLTTPYLGKKWFECVEACEKRAKELGMEAYAYDENGWPSGFVGGKLLEEEENHDMYIVHNVGEFDPNATVSYDISGDEIKRVTSGSNVLNLTIKNSVSTADVCNKKVVDKFIKMTHEEYKKHDIYGNLRGFFTDEPQYYRWDTPYTRVLPDYFKDKYNEDIFDRLGLLFVEKKGYRDFRYKYWKSMQELMLSAFAENIYNWCDKNNYKLTGHFIEENTLNGQMWCCAGIMPFYEFEQLPGIDYLGRDVFRSAGARQLGSVCSQLNKEQRMVEIFACSGWDSTPNELKMIAEYCMVGGVNIICSHLLPYSEHGQRKRDHAIHFSNVNPWVEKDFRTFNDYFSDIGEKLAKSKEIANVAVLHPIRSTYFDYKHDDANCNGIQKITASFLEDNIYLEKMHLPYHYLDEVILAKYGGVSGNQIYCGAYKYDYLIIPRNVVTMDENTEKVIREYVKNGGKVLLLGDAPSYVCGDEHDYSYLKSNTTIEEIADACEMMVEPSKDIIVSYHIDKEGKPYIYAINIGEPVDVKVRRNSFKNALVNNKVINCNIHFDKYDSKMIYFTNDNVDEIDKKNIIKLGDKFKVQYNDKNYIALDYVAFSSDGVNYTKKIHYMGLLYKLLKENYRGKAYLKYDVNIKTVPSVCKALIEDTRTKEVYVNGVKVEKEGYALEKDLWKYDVAKQLKVGNNEIVVVIDYYNGDNVTYALFGEGVTESLRNCLAYDTTIEAMFLQGDFGVYGDFDEKNNCYIANEFYLDKQKDEVTNIVKDGFPFFRGELTISQEIDVKNTNSILKFDNRFQLIDVYVNDEFAKRLMFETSADLSKFLKAGKNNITLKIIISNRNLLGPHHQVWEELKGIGPSTFERFGSWDENNESPICLHRYSFVKVI